MHRAALALVLSASLLPACNSALRHAPSVPPLSISLPTPDPAWELQFTRTDGWTGADGAATIPLPGNRILWLWGDSWIGPVRDGKHAPGSAMINNAIAVQPLPSSNAPLPTAQFFWSTDPAGKPAAWAIPAQPAPLAGAPIAPEWFWPSGGGIVTPPNRLLVLMTRLGRIDQSDSIWNFRPLGSSLVIVDNPAADPALWRQTIHDLTPVDAVPGRQITWGAAVLSAGPHLLIYGIDATAVLNKQALLARAPVATPDHFDTWSFWTGRGWSSHPAEAAPLASPLASEASIHRLHGEYIMVYSELTLGPRILLRTASAPQGPWSEPTTLYDCPEPATDKRLFVYAPKAHPELSRPGELLISYCVNSTDFWDVAAHADKYRPRFIRIPLHTLHPAPGPAPAPLPFPPVPASGRPSEGSP